MIHVHNLSKHYGSCPALCNLNFSITPKTAVGILGLQGSGKTTLLRILAGYHSPTQGQVTLGGWDIQKHTYQAQKHLGYLPETLHLPPYFRVTEYLRYRAGLKGVRGRKINERVKDVIDLCELQTIQSKSNAQLSHSEKQAVGLADTLLNEPDILLLDQPQRGWDPLQKQHFQTLLTHLTRHHTLLLSATTLEEVAAFSTHLLILDQGHLLQYDLLNTIQTKWHSLEDLITDIGILI